MKHSSFTARPFRLPDALMRAAAGASNLTPVLHQFKGRTGDYDLAKSWHRRLSRDFNWVGATMMFNVVYDYYCRERSGDGRYRQFIIERDGKPAGYMRLLHLSRDTATRREDCTKIEETLVADPADIKDPALMRFMYDLAVKDAKRAGKSRVITELGVGLPPGKFGSFARTVAKLSAKPARSEKEEAALRRARRMLERDWSAVTADFVKAMGCTITDVIIPRDPAAQITPQIRISRLAADHALPLPPYRLENRICRSGDDLAPLEKFVSAARSRSVRKYDLR